MRNKHFQVFNDPIMSVSSWQLHQSPKLKSIPTAVELNSDSE